MITSLFINANAFNPSPVSAQQDTFTFIAEISSELGKLT